MRKTVSIFIIMMIVLTGCQSNYTVRLKSEHSGRYEYQINEKFSYQQMQVTLYTLESSKWKVIEQKLYTKDEVKGKFEIQIFNNTGLDSELTIYHGDYETEKDPETMSMEMSFRENQSIYQSLEKEITLKKDKEVVLAMKRLTNGEGTKQEVFTNPSLLKDTDQAYCVSVLFS